MRLNLDTTHGLIMAERVTFALAPMIGKSEAHHLVEAASKKAIEQKLHLREVLTSDPKFAALLDPRQAAELFDPASYQGVSQSLIDRLLASLEGRYMT
jgi:3-carboxy-cis,cis-muconate cycloisomerase